jgi:hypothetical protein
MCLNYNCTLLPSFEFFMKEKKYCGAKEMKRKLLYYLMGPHPQQNYRPSKKFASVYNLLNMESLIHEK